MYDFGLYHWRRRFRTILSALAVILSAEVCRRTAESRWIRLVATAALLGGAVRGVSAARRLLSPPPWTLDRGSHATLAGALPFAQADHALDIRCGTGRSLVGLAPSVPDSCTVLGLDVFDDRIILGRRPGARRAERPRGRHRRHARHRGRSPAPRSDRFTGRGDGVPGVARPSRLGGRTGTPRGSSRLYGRRDLGHARTADRSRGHDRPPPRGLLARPHPPGGLHCYESRTSVPRAAFRAVRSRHRHALMVTFRNRALASRTE